MSDGLMEWERSYVSEWARGGDVDSAELLRILWTYHLDIAALINDADSPSSSSPMSDDKMLVSAPVPRDAPLMVAWTAYTQTEDYANTLRWLQPKTSGEGELWAAFCAGFAARGIVAGAQDADTFHYAYSGGVSPGVEMCGQPSDEDELPRVRCAFPKGHDGLHGFEVPVPSPGVESGAERDGMQAFLDREELMRLRRAHHELHVPRYENLREALGVRYSTAEEVVAAAINAIQELRTIKAHQDAGSVRESRAPVDREVAPSVESRGEMRAAHSPPASESRTQEDALPASTASAPPLGDHLDAGDDDAGEGARTVKLASPPAGDGGLREAVGQWFLRFYTESGGDPSPVARNIVLRADAYHPEVVAMAKAYLQPPEGE